MNCEEQVTIVGTYGRDDLTRGCIKDPNYALIRRSDGDIRFVCGTHKNQLVKAGWEIDKDRTSAMRRRL